MADKVAGTAAGGSASTNGFGWERIVTLAAAAALLGAFLCLSHEMIEAAKLPATSDTSWARMFAVYSGLSAIASAAAGVLLGTQVQRGTVIAAKAETESARREEARVKQGIVDYAAAGLPRGGGGDGAGAAEAYARLLQLVR